MSINENCPDLAKALYLSGYDGKNVVDAGPADGLTFAELGNLYDRQREDPNFNLGAFVVTHMNMRDRCAGAGYIGERERLLSHANQLIRGNVFYQPEDKGTLIGLPNISIQPCPGRFSEEQYEHDTGKIIKGLSVDTAAYELHDDVSLTEGERWDLAQALVDNQVYLQRRNTQYGHRIPTANRKYYLSRHQISYHASNINTLAERYEQLHPGQVTLEHPLLKYQHSLLTEWHFWNGARRDFERGDVGKAIKGVVLLDNAGTFGGYYLDGEQGPRLESWAEDMAALKKAQQRDPSVDPVQFFEHWRSGAISAWDYSSERHFRVPDDPTTIQASHVIHVDHTSKQMELEETLAKSYELQAFHYRQQHNESAEVIALDMAARWQSRSLRTAEMIRRYHRDPETGYYYDYNYRTGERTRAVSTAGMYPLLVGAVTQEEAAQAVQFFEEELVRSGGIRVTNQRSSQQWDGLSWPGEEDAVAQALYRYKFVRLGFLVTDNLINSNQSILAHTGSLPENFDPDAPLGTGSAHDGSEGEYERQQNFTWSATSIRVAHVLRRRFADMLEELPIATARQTVVVQPRA